MLIKCPRTGKEASYEKCISIIYTCRRQKRLKKPLNFPECEGCTKADFLKYEPEPLDTMKCQICGTVTRKNSVHQKYCVDCRLKTASKQERLRILNTKPLYCADCKKPIPTPSASRNQKYCYECRYKRNVEAQRKYNRLHKKRQVKNES